MILAAVPFGTLLGALGETVRLRATLFIGAAGTCAAIAVLLASPVRTLHELAGIRDGGASEEPSQ